MLRLPAVLLAVAALLTACGGSSASSAHDAPAELPRERPAVDVDGVVQVADGGLHLRCVGAGDVTVVLVSGWSDGGDSWGPVEDGLRGDSRVCSYAPFGTGTSDPASAPQTFRSQAADLAELLEVAGEPGPFVVVGHSFGGAQAVSFADQRPDDVTGMVLVDASPVSWPATICAVPEDGSDTAAQLGDLCAAMHDADLDPVLNPERLRVAESFDEVATIRSLGDLPLSVLLTADRAYGDLGSEPASRLSAAFEAGNQRWASLSERSELTFVPDSGHYIQLDQPAVVIRAIRDVLGRSVGAR